MNHDLKCEYNKKTLNRIHRIQGQMNALEALIAKDEGTCEERVVQARAIEKGMTNLISHMVECYLVNTARDEIQADPENAVYEISRIFDLLNR